MIRNWWLQRQMAPQVPGPVPPPQPIVGGPQTPPPPPAPPVNQLDALKQSLGIYQNPRDQAWKGISHMLGNFSNILQGRGVEPYPQEDVSQFNQNLALLKYLEEQRQAQERMSHKMAELEEMKRYHNMQKAAESKEERIAAQTAELQQQIPDAVPLSALSVGAQTAAIKELRERANLAGTSIKALRTADALLEILNDHPNLSTSLGAALYPKDYKGGFTDTLKLNLMGKKDRAALEKMNKLASRLVLHDVKGLGGQRANLFIEKIMAAANPHGGLTRDTVQVIRDDFKREFEDALADSKRTREAISGRYYIPKDIPDYEEEHKKEIIKEIPAGTPGIPSSMDFKSLKLQYPKLNKFSDAEIADAME